MTRSVLDKHKQNNIKKENILIKMVNLIVLNRS